jgi:hypothetical protein
VAQARRTMQAPVADNEPSSPLMSKVSDLLFGSTGPRGGKRDGVAQMALRSAVRTVGSSIGREIVRGVLGGLLGSGKRRWLSWALPAQLHRWCVTALLLSSAFELFFIPLDHHLTVKNRLNIDWNLSFIPFGVVVFYDLIIFVDIL